MDNGLCDSDCRGYFEEPTPGHLWPNEWEEPKKPARARAEPREPKVSLGDIEAAFERNKEGL